MNTTFRQNFIAHEVISGYMDIDGPDTLTQEQILSRIEEEFPTYVDIELTTDLI